MCLIQNAFLIQTCLKFSKISYFHRAGGNRWLSLFQVLIIINPSSFEKTSFYDQIMDASKIKFCMSQSLYQHALMWRGVAFDIRHPASLTAIITNIPINQINKIVLSFTCSITSFIPNMPQSVSLSYKVLKFNGNPNCNQCFTVC